MHRLKKKKGGKALNMKKQFKFWNSEYHKLFHTGGMVFFSCRKWPLFSSTHIWDSGVTPPKYANFDGFLPKLPETRFLAALGDPKATCQMTPDTGRMSYFSHWKWPPFVSTRTGRERVTAFKIWKLWWISPKPKLPSARSLAGLGSPNATSDLTLRHWGNEGFFPWKMATFAFTRMVS